MLKSPGFITPFPNIGDRSYLPSGYDSSMSIYQELTRIREYLGMVVKSQNELIGYVDANLKRMYEAIKDMIEEIERFEGDIEDRVIPENLAKILNEWFENGKLAEIINEQVFNMKADKKDVGDIKDFGSKPQTVVQNIIDAHVNVKNFGAKGDADSDTPTDDTQAFKDAIAYCKLKKIKRLYVPDGKYYITSSLDTGGSLESGGVELFGSNPQLVNMDWTYTRPSSTEAGYQKYLKLASGSIIATDKDIVLFSNGLVAKDIGLYGNLKSNCTAIRSIELSELKLDNVPIRGFGKLAIDIPFGVIFAVIQNSTISQNKGGILFGKENGSYTGETNFTTIYNNQLTKNEDYGIAGDIKGRATYIIQNDFEGTGEPSDGARPKPLNYKPYSSTNRDGIKYGCSLTLHQSGGFQHGVFVFDRNYSEESFGLLYVKGEGAVHGVSIQNNVYQPYNREHPATAFYLDGWLTDVECITNSLSGTVEKIYFGEDSNLKNIRVDEDYKGFLRGRAKPTIATRYKDDDKTYVNLYSNGVNEKEKFPAGLITELRYDEAEGHTYVVLDTTKAPDYDFGPDGLKNQNVGYALKQGNTYFGIIRLYSTLAKTWWLHGNRSAMSIGDGSCEIVQVGGIESINGNGEMSKIVADWDGTTFGMGK